MVLSSGEYWAAWYSKNKEVDALMFARREISSVLSQAVIDKHIQELIGNKVHRVYSYNCYILENIDLFVDVPTNTAPGWKFGTPTNEFLKHKIVKEGFEKFLIDHGIQRNEFKVNNTQK